MKSDFICISCPVGCSLTIQEVDGEIVVIGNDCARGRVYGIKEYTSPERMVTSSVAVDGGIRPLVPCKTAAPVPKAKVAEVLAAIRDARIPAPVALGQVLIPDAAGTGVDVIATRNIGAA